MFILVFSQNSTTVTKINVLLHFYCGILRVVFVSAVQCISVCVYSLLKKRQPMFAHSLDTAVLPSPYYFVTLSVNLHNVLQNKDSFKYM